MPKASVSWQFSTEDYESVKDFLSDLKMGLSEKEIGTLEIDFGQYKTKLNGIHSHF